MENLIKLRPPKGVSPIVRSPSKSTGKEFLITPIKIKKNEQPPAQTNQRLLNPYGEVKKNSQTKPGNKIPPSPNKIQLILPPEEK